MEGSNVKLLLDSSVGWGDPSLCELWIVAAISMPVTAYLLIRKAVNMTIERE